MSKRLRFLERWGLTLVLTFAASAATYALAPDLAQIRTQRYRWKSVAIVGGGFVTGITFHPNAQGVAYARTDIGGAYRWNEGKQRWSPLLDWLTKADWNLYGIEALAIDPSNPKRLYLACGTYTNRWGSNGAILASQDEGRSFTRAQLPFKLGGNEDGRSMGERLVVDPKHPNVLYFGTRNQGLWFSEDFGRDWSQLSTFPTAGLSNGIGVTSIAFDSRGKDKLKRTQSIYVGVASRLHNLYHSGDGGVTWTPVDGLPQGMFAHHLASTDKGKLYVTLTDGAGPNGVTNGAVYRWDIDPNIWTDVTPVVPNREGEKGFGYAGLSVSKSTVAVSTLDRWSPGDEVFYSTDDAHSWTALRSNSRLDPSAAPYMTWGQPEPKFGWWIGTVAIDPYDKGRVFYGTGANIWGCEDVLPDNVGLPILWTIKGQGIEETADIDLLSPPSGPHLITALGDIGGFTHQDLDRPPAGMSLNPLLGNTDSLSASSDGEVIVKVGRPNQGQAPGGISHDNGLTWKPFLSVPFSGAGGGSVATSTDGKIIVWSPNRSAPFWSADEANTWHRAASVTEPLQLIADPQDGRVFYGLGSSGRVFVSSDGGLNFRPSGASTGKVEHGLIRMHPTHPGRFYIPTASGLLVSTDGGRSFTSVPGIDAADSVGFGKPKADRKEPTIFLNGRIRGLDGVFRSDDGGLSWFRITDAAHEYGTRGVVIGDPRIYGRVYVGTNGRGVLYGDPQEATRGQ